ncbi:hypothetical protein ACVBIL_16880 [Shewanella sp. 125m-7]
MVFKANTIQNSSYPVSALPVMLIANIWEMIFEHLIYRMPKSANRQVNTEKKA